MARPAMADQASRSRPEPGVQAIAEPFAVGERQRDQRGRDVARHAVEHDADLLRHAVEFVGRAEGVDGIVGQCVAAVHGGILHAVGWTERAIGLCTVQLRKFR